MSWCVDTRAEATPDGPWSRPQLVHEPVELERLMWESLDRDDAVFKVTRVVIASVDVPYTRPARYATAE